MREGLKKQKNGIGNGHKFWHQVIFKDCLYHEMIYNKWFTNPFVNYQDINKI